MGLATFNIFIALTLSATVLSKTGDDKITTLTEDNITLFVNELADVSAGLKPDMDQYKIVDYMMAHLTEGGIYKSNISYNIEDSGEQERDMEMDRMKFISYVLEGLKAMEKHETRVDIQYIKIDDSGQGATVMLTNYERGVMPSTDAFGDEAMVPVLGTSFCEQHVILSLEKTIQLDGATCTTTINFEEAF
jgi:hypothetical protein